ncbi:MAG: hypothetical protein WC322_03085 [Candidatus Paceibacterota bacterium]|jgi:hypothetical protein
MSGYVRLDQVRKAFTFTDTLTSSQITTIETDAVDSEDFLGGVLSQFNKVIGATNWYDPVQSAAGEPHNLKTLTDNIYYKDMLRWRVKTQDVTVPATQNYVVLNATASETPAETAAVGAGSANGAVVAINATFGAHALTEVTGLNYLQPKNGCLVRDANTFDPILSGGRFVMALLQAETGVVDGDAFNDTDKRAQLSFVRSNAAGTALEAVPVADIEGKVVNFSYGSRTELNLANEQDFQFFAFSDPTSTASITLNQAYIGGNTIDVQTSEGTLTFNLSQDTTVFQVQRNGANFMSFTRNDTTGDVVQVDADTVDMNLTNDLDVSQGIKADTAGTTINIGVTAGQIDASTFVVRSTTGDLTLDGADDVLFKTVRETTALPLDDATAGAISALPGGPYTSVSAAIRKALLSSDLDIFVQTLANNYARDANVPGATETWSPALDLTNRSISMLAADVANCDTLLFLNGVLLRGGTAVTNNDVYKGTTPANGDLMYDFTKGVKTGDQITAISWYAA